MTIKDRLENWSRWSRWYTWGGGADCMTGAVCERLRKAALGDVLPGAIVPPDMDEADAEMVERAWRVQLPKHKAILRFTYIHNASPEFICRRLKMPARPRSLFDLELARAQQAIEKTLVNRQFPAHNVGTI